MMSGRLGVLVVVGALLWAPAPGYAQEASLSGTVTDSTGAVLPGVTVSAVNEASGNVFEAVTDERGTYRMPTRTGTFRVTAALAGFTDVTRTGVMLLVGQQAVVNIELTLSSLAESVTVTGEAPLLETTSSSMAGNIDPRQMQELPLNGRNWMDLTLLAPGARGNASADTPLQGQGFWQLNVDGQQVTQLLAGTQQPRYSRDAIAEFEFVSNRFDATQGRSAGVQVNAITKGGTNTPAGTFSGFFRDDRFNAADFIEDRVLPYSNQQLSATFGGPIRRDRIHFFANYEFEREPQTVTYNSPYPSFNIDQSAKRNQHLYGGRIDTQFTPRQRLAVRFSRYDQHVPFLTGGGGGLHPSAAGFADRAANQWFGTLTQVLSNRAINEIKTGYAKYNWTNDNYVIDERIGGRGIEDFASGRSIPRIVLRGYQIGAATNSPQDIAWSTTSIRDDFTLTYNAKGRHDLKLGGEYLRTFSYLLWCSFCNGRLDANGGAVPANVESLFPVWDNPSTWNLNALSPLSVRYRQSVGDFEIENPRHIWAAWLQDDWHLTDRLTANLGIRYDLDLGGIGENVDLQPWMSTERRGPDTNNVAPRLGFAYSLTDRTVVRGGYGLYFTQLENDAVHQPTLFKQIAIPEVRYDGRADFASNPFNGPVPTYDQVIASLCSTSNTPGCVRRDITSEIPTPGYSISYSHQASFGVQRQLGPSMSIESNYVYTGSRKDEVTRNMNLTYNPATGTNYPSADISRRPFPEWGFVLGEWMIGRSNYHGWETAFTKRFSDRWQAGATYALGFLKDSPGPVCEVFRDSEGLADCRPLTFPVARDVGDDYDWAAGDQRHRAVFNGIWEVGAGFQVSGLYFYGSGLRNTTTFGSDLRDTGTGLAGRLRPDGTIIPRAGLVGEAVHRVDARVQRRFAFGPMRVDGILEIFNVFNRENFGSYITDVSAPNYGAATFNNNIAFQPRSLQLGFRASF
jgi:hypothetical protein